jgi:hypothetical protein
MPNTKNKKKKSEELCCASCGLKPRADGQDPCIPNLPGVIGACCGHGQRWGYIEFENGTSIFGDFQEILHETGGVGFAPNDGSWVPCKKRGSK